MTLERKDRQRESKTQLLLLLKQDVLHVQRTVVANRHECSEEVADERERLQKVMTWIQQTLKVGKKQYFLLLHHVSCIRGF